MKKFAFLLIFSVRLTYLFINTGLGSEYCILHGFSLLLVRRLRLRVNSLRFLLTIFSTRISGNLPIEVVVKDKEFFFDFSLVLMFFEETMTKKYRQR